MIFVGVLGLLTALVSIVHNSILFYTFSTSRLLRKRNFTYLQWMAGCDTFVSLSYIFIMCTQVPLPGSLLPTPSRSTWTTSSR